MGVGSLNFVVDYINKSMSKNLVKLSAKSGCGEGVNSGRLDIFDKLYTELVSCLRDSPSVSENSRIWTFGSDFNLVFTDP